MEEYSYAELMQMQNDAIKRAQDMQSRARRTAGMEGEKPHSSVRDEPRRVPMPNGYLTGFEKRSEREEKKETPPKEIKKDKDGLFENFSSNLGNINIDSDSALLLSLIMLLSEEGADEILLLALIYML